jgi:urease accessory protein
MRRLPMAASFMSSVQSTTELQDLVGSDLQLLRLFRLASPMLPVGAFSYSQGLEAAVELGWVRGESSAKAWLNELLIGSVGSFDAPVWCRLYRAYCVKDAAALANWNDRLQSARETQELRAESAQMGHALRRLMECSGEFSPAAMRVIDMLPEISFATAFAIACGDWRIDERAGLIAYLWSWLENQVAGAMKIVPLGQVAGQRLLAALMPKLVDVAQAATGAQDDALSSFLPGLAIASCAHETQYSRLFRS